MFSSSSFMVLLLTFGSVIRFELNFFCNRDLNDKFFLSLFLGLNILFLLFLTEMIIQMQPEGNF